MSLIDSVKSITALFAATTFLTSCSNDDRPHIDWDTLTYNHTENRQPAPHSIPLKNGKIDWDSVDYSILDTDDTPPKTIQKLSY